MKADAKGRVLEQTNERLKGLSVSGFTQYLGRLGPDFHIFVIEELKQGSDRALILVLPVGPAPRHLAYSPDCVEAGQLVFGLFGCGKKGPCLFSSDQFELSRLADS